MAWRARICLDRAVEKPSWGLWCFHLARDLGAMAAMGSIFSISMIGEPWSYLEFPKYRIIPHLPGEGLYRL